MDDDFNTTTAISDLFSICKYINTLIINKKFAKEDISMTLSQIKAKLIQVFSIIGLLNENPQKFVDELRNKHLNILGISTDYIESIILRRANAKAEKNYEIADKLRNSLMDQGIILNDSKDGTSWDIKELYNIGIE
jgi:cysteinyl-tRNA synthetase